MIMRLLWLRYAVEPHRRRIIVGSDKDRVGHVDRYELAEMAWVESARLIYVDV